MFAGGGREAEAIARGEDDVTQCGGVLREERRGEGIAHNGVIEEHDAARLRDPWDSADDIQAFLSEAAKDALGVVVEEVAVADLAELGHHAPDLSEIFVRRRTVELPTKADEPVCVIVQRDGQLGRLFRARGRGAYDDVVGNCYHLSEYPGLLLTLQ